MCFSIPKKIQTVNNDVAITEDGKTVKLGNIKAKSGDYIYVYADAAVEKLSKNQAQQARQLIKELETNHV